MTESTGADTPEDVVLGCLIDETSLTYPSDVADCIVKALREAGMLRDDTPMQRRA